MKRLGPYAVGLAALIVLLYAFDLGGWPIETNDEARFPMMARDILANGHWLLPEIAGAPMLNKPPLHAWLIALASLPGGAVTAKTAALPSLVAGLALVLATAWLGSRLFGAAVGLTAGFVSATTEGLFFLAHLPLPDATLTLAMIVALGAFAIAEFEGRPRALIVFYGATGLAFLVKGPVGLIPVAIGVVYEFVAHGRRGVRRLLSPSGLLLLGLLVVSWPLLGLSAGGSTFTDKVLLKDMHDTYFGLGGLRWQRLTKPILAAVSHLLPWVIVAPVAIWSAVREADARSARLLRFPLVWAATAFALLAIGEQQRFRYYLPLVPPVALLVAAWYHRLPARRAVARVSVACAALVVIGLWVSGLYEARLRGRHTALDDVVRTIASEPAPTFAVDSPDIVFHFYLERPVVPLTYYSQFALVPGVAYLIASERAARAAPASAGRVAVARVRDRTYVLLRKP